MGVTRPQTLILDLEREPSLLVGRKGEDRAPEERYRAKRGLQGRVHLGARRPTAGGDSNGTTF